MERNPTKTDIDFLLRQITTEDNKLSFQRLFELYYPALCIYTKRFISDRETREDIVQEVFSSIWENRKRIVIRTSARNYLITAIKNHSLNYLQRNHEMRKVARSFILGKNYKPYFERHLLNYLKTIDMYSRRIALRIRVTARSRRICKYPYGQ